MEILQNLINSISWETLLSSALRIVFILAIAWAVMAIIKRFLRRMETQLIRKSEAEGEPPSESQKRIETIVRLLRQGTILAVWTTTGLVVLRELGIEVGPIIASAGVVGLAVGFGAQNLVRDIIAGFFIILENQVRVGDVAVINGTGGLVQRIGFRTIVLRDLGGIVHVFPNGAITTLSNVTKDWSAYIFEIGVAYKEDTDRVVEIMKEVGHELREDETVGKLMLEEPDIFGVDKLADSAVIIKGRIRTKPIRRWRLLRPTPRWRHGCRGI